jgi:sugar phosphate permease
MYHSSTVEMGHEALLQAGLGLSEQQLLVGTGLAVIVAALLMLYTGYNHPRWTGFAAGEEWETEPDAAAEKTKRYARIYGIVFVVLGLLFLLAAVLR